MASTANRAQNYPDYGKAIELMVYVTQELGENSTIALTKLYNALFCCDFLAYRNLGRSITDLTWYRLSNGPAPLQESRGGEVIAVAEAAGALKDNGRETGISQLAAKRGAMMNFFSGEELNLINEIINEFNSGANERELLVSICQRWELAEENEMIPYQIALVGKRKPGPNEVERAKRHIPAARKIHSIS